MNRYRRHCCSTKRVYADGSAGGNRFWFRSLDSIKGHVEFKHVSFSYHPDDTPVLEDISFAIAPGEVVALVGALRQREIHHRLVSCPFL